MLDQQLAVLFVKLAVAASVASLLTRIPVFARMLMRDQRTMPERLVLAAGFGLVFGAGVATRVVTRSYLGIDLGLEGSLLAGILGGYVTGLGAGILIAIPAIFNHELLSLPLYAGVGVLGGLLRDIAPDPEEIWRFSPFPDLGFYRLIRRWRDYPRTFFHLTFFLTIVSAELLRILAVRMFDPKLTFSLQREWPQLTIPAVLALCATTLFAVAVPLKIWNNTRNEKKLEAQQRLLTEARLAALTSQINPHFLFNTLNTVAALIRLNPEKARVVVHKLSAILRRLLRNTDNLNPLRDELSFIDDYLAIEMTRFGDKLRFVKEVDPATLDRLVPSMLLQPIVENSIKHGLSSKVDGGMIRVRSRLADGWLQLLIEDDGVGIAENRLATLFELGIGVSNVNERLKVLFGSNYRLGVDSKPGEGTRTEIEIPDQLPLGGTV